MARVVLIFSILFGGGHAWAGNPLYITKEFIQKMRIHKDGRREIHTKIRYEVTSEKALEQLKSYRVPYNREVGKVKIINATVTNGKDILNIEGDNIRDSRVVAKSYGFDAMNMIVMKFPRIKVGSIIDIEYSESSKEPLFKEHFSKFLNFGVGGYDERRRFEIVSDREIYYDLNDPSKVIHIDSKVNKQGQFVFSANLKRPFGKVNALQAIQMDLKKLTFVLLSTDKDWYQVMRNTRIAYDKVINGVLPPTLDRIARNVSMKKSLVDKVNYGITQIIQKYNYLGDWRMIKGQLIPKDFKDLERTRYGDCKDFAAALTAILRRAGVNAHVAWLQRGNMFMRKYYESDLVFLSGFNHAVVYIRDSGKDFWVDPTQKYVDGFTIGDDIALSEAFVLETKGPGLRKLPPIELKDHRMRIQQTYNFRDIERAESRGRIQLSGRFSANFIGAEKKLNKTEIEKNILALVSIGEKKTFPDVKGIDLKGSSNRELSFSFKYAAEKLTHRRRQQNYIQLPLSFSLQQIVAAKGRDQIVDIFLGQPSIFMRRLEFKGVHFAGKRYLKCDIDSKWISLKRHIEPQSNLIVYHEELKLKLPNISSSDFKSRDYKMLALQLRNCSKRTEIPIALGARKGKDHLQKMAQLFNNAPAGQRIEKRYQTAKQVFDSRQRSIKSQYNLDDAYQLMVLNIEENPLHQNSYLLLSRILVQKGEKNAISFAEEYMDIAMKKIARRPPLLLEKARYGYLSRKDEREALKLIAEARQKVKKENAGFWSLLAGVYRTIDKRGEFLNTMEEWKAQIVDATDRGHYYWELAMFYQEQKEWGKCVQHYEAYLKDITDNALAYANIGACYRKQKYFDKAVASYQNALKIEQLNKAEVGLILSYIGKGHLLLLGKQFKQAKLLFHKALAIHPHEEAYYNLAILDFAATEINRGLSNIEQVLKRTQRYGTRAQLLGNVLELARRVRKGDSIALIEGLLEVSTRTEIKLLLATAIIRDLYEQKTYDRAKVNQTLKLIEEIKGTDANWIKGNDHAKVNLSMAYFQASLMTNNIIWFEQSVKILGQIEDPEKFSHQISPLKEGIEDLDGKVGRKPASLYWKGKRKLHIFLQEKLQYDLIDLGLLRQGE